MDEEPLGPIRDALYAALAAELTAVRDSLEEAAVSLCLDPAVFARHGDSLQRFDRLAQVVGEVAGVLRSREAPAHALAGIRLDALRDRLMPAEEWPNP